MKQFAIILFAAIILISCGKDKESDDPQPINSLVGTWAKVSRESSLTCDGKPYVQGVLDVMWGDPDEAWAKGTEGIEIANNDMFHTFFYEKMEIKNDGIWTAFAGTSGAPGKWSLSSDQKVVTMTIDQTDLAKMIGTITKLDGTNLWIEVKVKDKTDYFLFVVNYEYTSLLKFTKAK